MANSALLRNTLLEIAKDKSADMASNVEWLIAEMGGISRSEVLMGVELPSKTVRKIFRRFIRLNKGEPLCKILKSSNFYGRDFFVNRRVLCPRFETEELVNYVLNHEKEGVVLDLCCGSGVIAITLKKENEKFDVSASDISAAAIKVTRRNAKANGANINIVKSNLFDAFGGKKFDFVVCNPPYIKTSDIAGLETEVKQYDPLLALDGGEDGLWFYRKIIEKLPLHLAGKGRVYFEIGYDQAEDVKKLLTNDFEDVKIIKDIYNKDRIICATLK